MYCSWIGINEWQDAIPLDSLKLEFNIKVMEEVPAKDEGVDLSNDCMDPSGRNEQSLALFN